MKVKRISKYLIQLFIGALILGSCESDGEKDDEDEIYEDASYTDGFFVLNQGQFPDAGTVTFISQDLGSVIPKIFQKENSGKEVGNTPQSMFFDDEDRAFVIANGSNFITVANRYTFKGLDTISGEFNSPRYGIADENKAFVTNLGDTYLTVIDLEEMQVTGTVDLGETSEFILKGSDGLLYIQEASFDEGNQIAVFDPLKEEVIKVITTDESLNSIALTDNALFALTPTTLQKFDLDDYQESSSISLEYDERPANLVNDDNNLYFTSGNKVYKIDPNASTASESPVFEYESESGFGVFYGFTVRNGKFYLADGGDFASNSFIEVRDRKGDLLNKLKVGVGPSGFYFND